MKMLHVIGTLDPVYGGPPEVVKQYASAMADLGHYSEILTLDDPSACFHDNKKIIIHALGPALGKYRFTFRLIPWLIKNTKNFDVIICHGIWQYQSLATWIASRITGVPYFVFVHGALDPWFRYTYPLKHIKKWFYWPWAEYNVLRSAKAVLFISADEKAAAAKSFSLYNANGLVVPYGIHAPEGDSNLQRELFFKTFPALREKHILLFMSRIHQIKGCDILIEAFSKVAKENPLLQLVIAGPDETSWIPALQSQAQKLGIGHRITWTGMLKDDLKWGALFAASCFILPSHSENFGVVVVEALSCGLPVIISDKVNIWRDIQNKEAGFVNEDTLFGTLTSLRKWLALSKSEQDEMRLNAKKCFFENFEISTQVRKFSEAIQFELNK
jgi:glycosyltransferase involved in cell wall biosynthesis